MKTTAKQQNDEDGTTGDETILVVEDETSLLEVITLFLGRLGYNVISASGPIEALRFGRSCQDAIDMLLTDVVMPQMSGLILAEKLAASHPGLKCLYMSGYTSDVIAYHGVGGEGVQFIGKPFSNRDLAIKVRQILDMKQ